LDWVKLKITTAPVIDRFWLTVDNLLASNQMRHRLSLCLENPLQLVLGLTKDTKSWPTDYNTNFSPMSSILPPSLHLLSFDIYGEKQIQDIIIRINHLFEASEDPQNSVPVTVDLAKLFGRYNVDVLQETNLSGNQLKATMSRKIWKSAPLISQDQPKASPLLSNTVNKKQVQDSSVFIVKPLEFKTFSARFSLK